MTRDEVLTLMQTERERVWNAIAELSEEAMSHPARDGDWSVKDILAHLAFWEQDATQRLEFIAAGRSDKIRYYGSDEQIDETNADVYYRRRDWTLEQAMQALRRARERMLEALTAITDDQLASKPSGIPVLHWLAGDTYEHDQEHLLQLLAVKRVQDRSV
jgi:uncharacterized damage-inducible protein DinB